MNGMQDRFALDQDATGCVLHREGGVCLAGSVLASGNGCDG
jgi:hypothetical protein